MEKLIDILERDGYLVFKNETEIFINKDGNTFSWKIENILARLKEMEYNELSAILKHIFDFKYKA